MKYTTVTISKTKHASQPFLVTINPHGPAEPYKLSQRYATKATARRGALRQLNACTHPNKYDGRPYNYQVSLIWQTHKGERITITYK